jgi:hypothetical protein
MREAMVFETHPAPHSMTTSAIKTLKRLQITAEIN